MAASDWLDDDGFFQRGKYGPKSPEGARQVEDVAAEDPSYLRWVMGLDDIGLEDYKAIEAALKFRNHRRTG